MVKETPDGIKLPNLIGNSSSNGGTEEEAGLMLAMEAAIER
jgi:hypothetical protein